MSEYDDEREKYAQPIDLRISTKAPSKWRFVDLETGDVWKWVDPPEGISGERHFEPDHDFVISSEVMNERTRRRLDIRASGSAGPHNDEPPRSEAERREIREWLAQEAEEAEAVSQAEETDDPERAEEILTARDAARGVGPAVRGDLSNREWKARHWDTHYDQASE